MTKHTVADLASGRPPLGWRPKAEARQVSSLTEFVQVIELLRSWGREESEKLFDHRLDPRIFEPTEAAR